MKVKDLIASLKRRGCPDPLEAEVVFTNGLEYFGLKIVMGTGTEAEKAVVTTTRRK